MILLSSPLFDFSIDDNCGIKSHIIFHIWEGRKETEYYYSNGHYRSRTKIIDRTDLKKLNGKYFCYKHVSYRELLYNDQIRKEEEPYNGDYTYDCGIVDTLNQHLYIKDDEKCPLYDAGIGSPNDYTNFNYMGDSNLYYNNDNYYDNMPNKKIIGKLILNDGQPCYKLNEKLWKKFYSNEEGKEHLKCELEIFGNYNDERFKHKGDITYNQIYKDNLSDENYELLKNKLNDLKVSLYSREFLGIDKECDEKNQISKDKYDRLKKNQEKERICSLFESLIIFSILFSALLIMCIFKNKYSYRRKIEDILLSFLILFFLLFFICIICHSVFLGKIIYNDLSYNCSDDITNEVLKKENQNTKTSILYTSVNLGLDIFIILINVLVVLINCLINKYRERKIFYDSHNLKLKPDTKEKNLNFNSAQNKYKSDGISKESEMEVTVDNRTPIQEGQINKPTDNAAPNPTCIDDLVVPPPIIQGALPETKL